MSFVMAKEILTYNIQKYLTDVDSFTRLINTLNATREDKNNMTRKWPNMTESQFMDMMEPFFGSSPSSRSSSSVNNWSDYYGEELTSGASAAAAVAGSSSSVEELGMNPSIKVFFYCLYIIIFIIGMVGNVLVCYVVLRNKHMQTVTNIFIMNLALSDILLCVLGIPFTVLYLITLRNWVFGSIMCHLLPAAQGISVYIAAFTLMSIAIDRYFVILYPFRPRMAIKVCVTIISAIWIASILLTFPYGWFMTIYDVPDTDGIKYCSENWGSEESRYAFGFTTSTLQFIIPFGIISFCYLRVCLKLRERSLHRPGAPSARREEVDRDRTRKTNRMLIAMVVIFGLSWLPLNINNLIQDFYKPAETWVHARTFFLLAHAFAMSSTCYNPFLYAWLNENFRKEFKQLLPCFVNSTTRQDSINRRTMIGIDPRAGGRPARTSDDAAEDGGPPPYKSDGPRSGSQLKRGQQSSLDIGGPTERIEDVDMDLVGDNCNGHEMIPLKEIVTKKNYNKNVNAPGYGSNDVQHVPKIVVPPTLPKGKLSNGRNDTNITILMNGQHEVGAADGENVKADDDHESSRRDQQEDKESRRGDKKQKINSSSSAARSKSSADNNHGTQKEGKVNSSSNVTSAFYDSSSIPTPGTGSTVAAKDSSVKLLRSVHSSTNVTINLTTVKTMTVADGALGTRLEQTV